MNKVILFISVILLVGSAKAQTIDRSKAPQAGPAPSISIKDPVIFKLKNGMTVIVVENHKLPTVSARLMIDQGPIAEGEKAGLTELMGGMLSEGTRKMPKAVFDQQVDQMGADVSLSSTGGRASSLTRYFDKAFMLMADAIQEPAMSDSSLEKLKTRAINGLKAGERSVPDISRRVVRALSFGSDHPLGEFETEESLGSITLQDINEAYKKYITPARSYLTFVGDITPAKAKELAEKAFGNWKGNSLQLADIKKVPNVSKTEIDLIDVPNAVQSSITITNLVNIPMSSPDYFPSLLANEILGGTPMGRLFLNIREKHGFAYGASSSLGTGRFQSTFQASALVRNEKVDSAIAEMLKEIETLRTEKVTPGQLDTVKAMYTGNFALSLENPALPASFASTILINNLDKDFYRNYLKNIEKVSPEDVQRVANRYFNYDSLRIIVVGKAETVKPELERLGYTIKMFDKFANPVSETESKPVAADVSAKEVIDRYVKAIGGEDELKKINSISRTGSISVQGMNLPFEEKSMAPNRSLISLSMNGQVVSRDVFDGSKGWKTQMGQKIDYSEKETDLKKDVRGLFNQLYYFSDGYKTEVAGSEKVDGKDAYRLKVTSPSGQVWNEWYDANTGYLLQTETTMDMQGQPVTQIIDYSDYKKVGNVLFPFTSKLTLSMAGGQQEMTMQYSDVKLNEGVSESDFQ